MEDLKLVTLKAPAEATLEEKKSVFIGHAAPVSSEEEALGFVRKIKSEFADAKHNVYAYTVGRGAHERYSDDSEPQGTAGMPVLDVLRKGGIDNACIVVTRYFGGILLGAGGLVRAYSAAAAMAVERAGVATFVPFDLFSLTCSYADQPKLTNLLRTLGVKMGDTAFSEVVTLSYSCKQTESDRITAALLEATAGRVIPQKTSEILDTI